MTTGKKKKKKRKKEEKKQEENRRRSQSLRVRGHGVRPYLVGDAVEDLHGQIRHLGERVGREVKQHPPDLSVHTVEGHTWNTHTSSGHTHTQFIRTHTHHDTHTLLP